MNRSAYNVRSYADQPLNPNRAIEQHFMANAARDIGYDTDSIATFQIQKSFTDFLLCQICCKMSRDAKECDYCNKLFCRICIENWLLLNKNCPMCHKDIKIRGASRVVKEIINSFKIKCSFCPKTVQISEIEEHEAQCGLVICDNPLCKKLLKTQKYYEVVTSGGKLSVCNDICEQMAKLKRLISTKSHMDLLKFFQATLSSGQQSISSDKRTQIKPTNPDIENQRYKRENDHQFQRLHNLEELVGSEGTDDDEEVKIYEENLDQVTIDEELGVVAKLECMSAGSLIQNQRDTICSFTWDPSYTSDVIKLECMNRQVFLKEDKYVFRSVISDKSFTDGIHYWEIIADARSENEIKAGVCKKRDFDLKTAFSDYSFGWAYYATGQLRHCDGANGQSFGSVSFKKEGVLGVFLDMNKGQLAIAVNNQYLGVAFEDEELKKGPIWPAIALLHVAGCTLVTGRPAPSYFFV